MREVIYVSLWQNKEMLKQAVRNNSVFSEGFNYNDKITLYPVRIRNYIDFSLYKNSIIINQKSSFPSKEIIKMSYWKFLTELSKRPELGKQFGDPMAGTYLLFALKLIQMVCRTNEISINQREKLVIKGCEIDDEGFDDLRRIIIIQNNIDYDIDNYINADTERGLRKAAEKLNRNKDKSTFEDYIDSLAIYMQLGENEIGNLTINKFWRYITRINLRDNFIICRTGEAYGTKFKEPIKHWMNAPDKDKNKDIKTDREAVKQKIG